MLAIAAIALAVGLAVQFAGVPDIARVVWIAGIVFVLATLLVEIFASLRHGEVGLDVVAALFDGASLAFDAPLAGIVVALMYSGGQYLEAFAGPGAAGDDGPARARGADCHARPRRQLEETPIDAIQPGDRLLIRPGGGSGRRDRRRSRRPRRIDPDGRVAAGRAPRRC